MTNVRIEDVIVTRDVEAEPLPEGLGKKVYESPLILRGDLVLIDGVRRLRRAQAAGKETISAIVSSAYPEIMSALAEQNSDMQFQVTPRRLWEVDCLVFNLGVAWTRAANNGGWEKLDGGRRVRRAPSPPTQLDPEKSARFMMVQAFGYSRTATGHILFIYRRANGGDVAAQELVKKVDAGVMSPQKACMAFHRPAGMVGNVVGTEEQQRLLERGSLVLAAQMDALQKLGHPVTVSTEELERHLRVMFDTRRGLTQMINGLRKLVKENKNG
jgi:hypothetical protein